MLCNLISLWWSGLLGPLGACISTTCVNLRSPGVPSSGAEMLPSSQASALVWPGKGQGIGNSCEVGGGYFNDQWCWITWLLGPANTWAFSTLCLVSHGIRRWTTLRQICTLCAFSSPQPSSQRALRFRSICSNKWNLADLFLTRSRYLVLFSRINVEDQGPRPRTNPGRALLACYKPPTVSCEFDSRDKLWVYAVSVEREFIWSIM